MGKKSHSFGESAYLSSLDLRSDLWKGCGEKEFKISKNGLPGPSEPKIKVPTDPTKHGLYNENLSCRKNMEFAG